MRSGNTRVRCGHRLCRKAACSSPAWRMAIACASPVYCSRCDGVAKRCGASHRSTAKTARRGAASQRSVVHSPHHEPSSTTQRGRRSSRRRRSIRSLPRWTQPWMTSSGGGGGGASGHSCSRATSRRQDRQRWPPLVLEEPAAYASELSRCDMRCSGLPLSTATVPQHTTDCHCDQTAQGAEPEPINRTLLPRHLARDCGYTLRTHTVKENDPIRAAQGRAWQGRSTAVRPRCRSLAPAGSLRLRRRRSLRGAGGRGPRQRCWTSPSGGRGSPRPSSRRRPRR
mmetsp:Transcript_2996/g.9989  ORF Transcript_2996/g.9989 Transcript_2996/m.9989 type:complete len:283 (-) Transcript_2996:598-1446(-)